LKRRALWIVRCWPLLAALAVTGSSAQVAERCSRRAAEKPSEVKAAPAAVAQLQKRRDECSLALADYLLAASGSARADAARASLQDRARSSTDPMLTVLALHMPCVRAGCRNIEASQWSRLEPANLLAWLALPGRSAMDGSYLMDQIATHVRYSRDYRQEASALLSELPPSGLQVRQPWGLLNIRALASSCRGPMDATRAERCESVAELLWAEGGATEKLMALLVAQPAQALAPQHGALWEPRLRELEALWRKAGADRGALSGATPPRDLVCEAIVLPMEGERAAISDLDRARMVLRLAGLSVWDLRPRVRTDGTKVPP
jgi:hypothetical protein